MANGKIKIGVACVAINKKNQVLMGKRIAKHGNGMWQFPGGHHEFGELIADTAVRETKEETDLNIGKTSYIGFTEEVGKSNQYLTFFYIGKVKGKQKAVNTEPHKCEGWVWFDIESLPEPLYEVDEGFLKTIKKAVKKAVAEKAK